MPRTSVLFLAVLLTACGSERCPTLPGGATYCLQPPALAPSFSVLQQIAIDEGERQETLLAYLENDPQRFMLVGLTPLGQTVLTVTWDGTHVTASGTPGVWSNMNPSVLVAVLQFGLWPDDAIRAGLSDDVVWKTEATEGELLRQGTALLTVHRTGKTIPFDTVTMALHPAKLLLNIHTLTDEGCCNGVPVP